MSFYAGMSPKSDVAGVDDEQPVERVVVPPGGRKRDTMIRELKSKLKEKFPTNTLASVVLTKDATQRVTKPQFR
jgi:hypothetical protein